MGTLKARVRGGRLVLDEPTDLPEGTEVELVPADDWGHLDDEERERLFCALDESEEDVRAGRLHDADEVIEELRRRQP